MKILKKALRLLGFLILIVLASAGVGIFGGIHIPLNKRRDNTIEMTIEPSESEDEENEIGKFITKE